MGISSRAWSDAEYASFYANPWQLFAPRSIYIPTGEAAAATNLYWVIGEDGTWPGTPTPTEVKAGQLSGGGAAVDSGSETSPTITTDPFDFATDATGLTAATDYRIAYVWSDGVDNSTVVVSGVLTTASGTFTVTTTESVTATDSCSVLIGYASTAAESATAADASSQVASDKTNIGQFGRSE